MELLKSVALVTALLLTGITNPELARAGDISPRKVALQPTKEAKKYDEGVKADDKAGPGQAGPDDRGRRLGLDDSVRDCFVYTASGCLPKPYLQYRSAADKARLEAEASLLLSAWTIHADEIAQFHGLGEANAPTFSMKAETYRLRHRLGARGCAS
jgi:hypothetical protein